MITDNERMGIELACIERDAETVAEWLIPLLDAGYLAQPNPHAYTFHFTLKGVEHALFGVDEDAVRLSDLFALQVRVSVAALT